MRKRIVFLLLILGIVTWALPAGAGDPAYDLDWAIMDGNLEEVKKILGAHPELADAPFTHRPNWRPLQWAVASSKNIAVIEYLLSLGVNVDARNNDGETALAIHATDLDASTAVAEVLIRHGADVNARDKDGLTPLKNATTIGKPEIIQLLRQNGAKE
jgi:26S proteasome non-ATPase regulatory subunit 10